MAKPSIPGFPHKKEPGGEEDTHKALVFTPFYSAAGKMKTCSEEKFVLYEHIRYSFTILVQKVSYPSLKSSSPPLPVPLSTS